MCALQWAGIYFVAWSLAEDNAVAQVADQTTATTTEAVAAGMATRPVTTSTTTRTV